MKYLKKVAVTPVTPNTGDIIDSFNTQDDKHTNAPSLNAVENYVGDLNTYSTNEQVIGTWIDNKPVYKNVLEITPLKTVQDGDWYYSYTDIENLHIENITYQYAFVNGLVTDRQINNNYRGNEAYIDLAFTDYRNSVPSVGYIKYVQIGLKSTYIDAGATIKLIIEYTKTTDTV